MIQEIFSKLFKNKFLFRLVFSYVKIIHRDLLKYTKVYKWDQVLRSVNTLARYGYLKQFKQTYNSNNNNIVKLLMNRRIPLTEILKSKRLDTLKFIIEDLKWYSFLETNPSIVEEFISLYFEAIHHSSLEIIQYLDEIIKAKGISMNFKEAFSFAPLSGNIQIIRYLSPKLLDESQNTYSDTYIDLALSHSIRMSRLDMFEYFMEFNDSLPSSKQFNIDWLDTYRMKWVISNGFIDIFQYLLKRQMENGRSIVIDSCLLDIAACNNQLTCLQYLHANMLGNCTISAMNDAASKGYLEVVRWLHENRAEGCNTKAMDDAAENGHFEVLKWLHHNRTEGCTTDAMDYTAQNGYLDIAMWLHENRTEGCTTNAMDYAALYGNLNVIKWLHENRTEGCTTMAMDYAALIDINIVEWLHMNRTEGCTTDAMDNAASKGHLDIIQWLHHNRTEGCTTKAMNDAARNGHIEIIKWLHHNQTEGCTALAICNAIKSNHIEIVKWLHENRTEGCGYALKEATFNGNLEIVKWLFLHCPNGCTLNVDIIIRTSKLNYHMEIANFLIENRSLKNI